MAADKIIPFYAVRPRAVLHVQCRFCKAEGELDVMKLAYERGPEFEVRRLGKALRCRRCNMSGWASMSLDWIE